MNLSIIYSNFNKNYAIFSKLFINMNGFNTCMSFEKWIVCFFIYHFLKNFNYHHSQTKYQDITFSLYVTVYFQFLNFFYLSLQTSVFQVCMSMHINMYILFYVCLYTHTHASQKGLERFGRRVRLEDNCSQNMRLQSIHSPLK